MLDTIINNYTDKDKWIEESVNFIKTSRAKRIALSGGETPREIYQHLAKQKDIDFKNISFFIVDERYVSDRSRHSNQKMIKDSLIKKVGSNFYHFNTKLSIEGSLSEYETKVVINQPFDLCILGIGLDGHIASLFPHSTALTTSRVVAHTQAPEFSTRDRLTLTFPAIMNSREILLLAKGEEKTNIINDMINSDKKISDLPARKLIRHSNLHIQFCF